MLRLTLLCTLLAGPAHAALLEKFPDRGWRIDDIGTASLPSLRRFLVACR